jgi:nucleoside-diphosphate-sugar epimerase
MMADLRSVGAKVFITGATGFIGKAVASALTDQGYNVVACVRPQKRTEITFCQVVGADLSQTETIKKAVDPCEVIIHAASIRNRWGTTPEQYMQVNVEGTRALLEAAVGKAKRFIFISSVGVHGYPGLSEIDEDSPLIAPNPRLDYHSSKVLAERIVREFSNQIETVIIRPTIIYGIGDINGMITRLIKMVAGRKYLQIGNGTNHIHLTYIDDLLDGLTEAMTSPAAIGQALILSGPESIEIRKICRTIKEILNITYHDFYIPENLARYFARMVEGIYRVTDKADFKTTIASPITLDKVDILCKHRNYSHAKAAKLLGYAPRINEATGLARTIEWMRTNRELPPIKTGQSNQ